MPGRYLITGGAGLVGATVTRALLARGDQATILDSGIGCGFEYLAGTAARIVPGDIRDPGLDADAFDQVVAVVHLAAQASVPGSIADPVQDFEINVRASHRLLEAARARGIRRFVFASSSSVVAGHPSPTHEMLTPAPVAPYGASKAAVEAYLRAYSTAFDFEGVALRFSNAYGPWSAHKSSVVASFVRAYLDGEPLVIRGDGRQTRDFVHTADVAAAVLAALDAPSEHVAGEVFQIATGIETSLRELAETLFEVGATRAPIRHEPPSAGDVPRNVSDISKARLLLGYDPAVSLRAGLAATLDWFRGNRHS